MGKANCIGTVVGGRRAKKTPKGKATQAARCCVYAPPAADFWEKDPQPSAKGKRYTVSGRAAITLGGRAIDTTSREARQVREEKQTTRATD
ncbi:Calcium/calmodulin-dependent serine/threonine-protein kinase 1 [Anopheles sinensis]|uniref:Calcium/calmodulin-dependent serine/threonine-protein kinase 1 n=1 Tax=Anopheles sinensis TaxID=74873 RepID=A0A084VFP8_ANOSI|nr:Calcium/calmodulin-dependent serine/threonine-protein kinase 1 [Anopheles sinensis]